MTTPATQYARPRSGATADPRRARGRGCRLALDRGTPVRPIYLDNHATTRCDPRVVDAMLPYFSEEYGNASSRSHRYGMAAREATEAARSQVASLIGASPKEL